MKKLSVIALSAMLMTAPAFAETSANYNTNQTVEQEVDLSDVFADNQNLQVATLSTQEMQETEGAWAPYAVAAAAVGSVINVNSYVKSVPQNERTFSGYATAAASGAVGGAITATPIGAIRAAVIGASVGIAGSGTANKHLKK